MVLVCLAGFGAIDVSVWEGGSQVIYGILDGALWCAGTYSVRKTGKILKVACYLKLQAQRGLPPSSPSVLGVKLTLSRKHSFMN